MSIVGVEKCQCDRPVGNPGHYCDWCGAWIPEISEDQEEQR
jgi:hypothetical protein